MRIRYEKQGLHLYNRVNGFHVLLDEVDISKEKIHAGPRVISIAITGRCNLKCKFCYVEKKAKQLDPDYIIDLCKTMDSLGVLEVALGGGEPILYPNIGILCKEIWNSTKLGISITTNGQLLSKKIISRLVGNISILRFSIDAIEPLYSKIRGCSFSNILRNIAYVEGKIPFGINMVINHETISYLDDVLKLSQKYKADNLLLLPQITNGKYILTRVLWSKLEAWINDNWKKFPLEVATGAREYMNCHYLFNSSDDPETNYWHINVDQRIVNQSYREGGELITDGSQLEKFFENRVLFI